MMSERVPLPLVAETLATPSHVFSAKELESCAEGRCCQCGRCCVVYRVFVPQQETREGVYEKLGREQCFHLEWDERGLASCGCQDIKDLPAMELCAEYNGRDGNYQDVVELTRQLLTHPKSEKDIQLLQDWLRRGLLSDVHDFPADASELRQFLHQIVTVLQLLPHDLFAFARIEEHIDQLFPEELQDLLADVEIDPEHPTSIQKEFLGRYCERSTNGKIVSSPSRGSAFLL